MSRLNTIEEFVGSTLRTTWINTGTVASPISSSLYDGSNALVSSLAQTSSGDGHYYADITLPMSPGWYVNEQIGVIGVNTYRRFQYVRVTRPEVD